MDEKRTNCESRERARETTRWQGGKLNFIWCRLRTFTFLSSKANQIFHCWVVKIPLEIHISRFFNTSCGNANRRKLEVDETFTTHIALRENLLNEWCIFIATWYHYSSGIMMGRYEARWRNVNIWVFLTLTRRRLLSFHHFPLWVIINFAKTGGNVVFSAHPSFFTHFINIIMIVSLLLIKVSQSFFIYPFFSFSATLPLQTFMCN